MNGIQEVSGSIPLISTKTDHKAEALWSVLYKRKVRNRIPGKRGWEWFRNVLSPFYLISSRPDVDTVYMAACVAMNGSGGWPLTVLLTPDWVGAYLPKAELVKPEQ